MKRTLLIVVAVLLLVVANASAGTIEVLFYGASASWNAALQGLADTAHTYDPDGDGSNVWNATFWNAGDPAPDFTNFDAFFIPTADVGFGSGMDPTRLLAEGAAISAARGTRTFLTGQDADWHYQFGPGAVDDGPRGFLINAVNWAASGEGMGIVSMTDGFFGAPSQWWTSPGSFLAGELSGHTHYFQDETVFIGPGQSGFPINEGLTSAGLSNWGVSSHSGFDVDTPGYVAINFEDDLGGGRGITIVSQGEEGGGTTPVPAPGTLVLLGLGLIGIGAARSRR